MRTYELLSGCTGLEDEERRGRDIIFGTFEDFALADAESGIDSRCLRVFGPQNQELGALFGHVYTRLRMCVCITSLLLQPPSNPGKDGGVGERSNGPGEKRRGRSNIGGRQ